jgi:hypothetical protein
MFQLTEFYFTFIFYAQFFYLLHPIPVHTDLFRLLWFVFFIPQVSFSTPFLMVAYFLSRYRNKM